MAARLSPIFPIFLTFSRYRVCYAAWNESIRLITRRTSDQARKGKNCQRETYLSGSASCSAGRQRPRKSGGGHGPGRNCCRHRRAVAPSAPCVRPRSSVAAHGRPDSIRREQLGLVGADVGLWAAAAPAGRGRGQRCSEQRPTQRNANCKTTRHPAGQPRPRT